MMTHWNSGEFQAPSLWGETAEGLVALLRSDALDALMALAKESFQCLAVSVSILGERQWFLSSAGHEMVSNGRQDSICTRTIADNKLTIIPDLREDSEFQKNPFVAAEDGIRFYAGLPLDLETDFYSAPVEAAFCLVDDKPRDLSEQEIERLRQFSAIASKMVESSVRLAGSRGRAEMQEKLVGNLVRKQVQFRQAEQMAQMGHWRLDLSTELVHWSDGIFEIHDLPVANTPELELALSFYTPSSRAKLEGLMARAIEEGEPYEADLEIVTPEGHHKRVRTRGEVEYQDGQAVALIGVFRDVTDRYELERKLRRAAQTDTLTGLGNRDAMRAFVANRSQDEKLAVLLLDLDGFKQVNDRLGHLTGDDVIKAMATTLRATVPPPHFVGRFGGDEFVVILMEDALTMPAEDLFRRLELAMVYNVEGQDDRGNVMLTVSASIGMHRAAPGDSLEEALAVADAALYASKRRRKTKAAAA